MAPRQRFIWPDLWDDPDLGRVSERAFILYIGCFSNADDEGRLIGDPVFLKTQIFRWRKVTIAQVEAARAELENACKAFHVYEKDGLAYVQFLNWHEWQRPKYPKPSKLPAPPRSVMRRQKLSGNHSGRASPRVKEGVPNASGTTSSVGWDGLGSTPLPPRSSRSKGTNPRARGTNPRSSSSIGLRQACARWIKGAGWDETFSEEMVVEEFQRIETAAGVESDGTFTMADALELWRAERQKRYPEAVVA